MAGGLQRFDRLRGHAISILGQAMTGHLAPADLIDPGLPTSERAWVLEVVHGVLRTRGRLEAVLAQLALKKSPTGWLKRALWVGGYSLMYQDRTAPAAVVSEVVDLVRSKEGKAPASFTNAILRKWAELADQFREPLFPANGTLADQARWASLPDWWWMEWSKQFGREEAAKMAAYAMARPQLWLRARPDSKLQLLKQGFESVEGMRGTLRPSKTLLESGVPLTEWPGFREGAWIVQDLSSQKIIESVSDTWGEEILDGEGWDVCAAPGGKTAALAWERRADAHGSFWASDLPGRLPLLNQTLERTRLRDRVQIHETGGDELVFPSFAKGPAWIWLDAPCTSSGLIRRHPEVRWQLRLEDRDRLQLRQAQLLARVLASGARHVVYSVCSLFESEGEGQVRRALSSAPEYRLNKQWTLPITADHDGFYAAILSRN